MQSPHILIIEDDYTLNNQLAQMLGARGYRVDQRHDGENGLTQALGQQYDLILLDVMLPGRDGYSLLGMLRKTCQTPVIMLTAKGAEEERIRGFSQGVDDYLTKPFSPAELMHRIEAVLRRCYVSNSLSSLQSIQIDDLSVNRVSQSASESGGDQPV